jgi:hypothetical protein
VRPESDGGEVHVIAIAVRDLLRIIEGALIIRLARSAISHLFRARKSHSPCHDYAAS